MSSDLRIDEAAGVKPKLRGHFHQAAFFCACGAGAMLIEKAASSKALSAIVIYVLSLCGLLGISALYHRVQWKPEIRIWLRRLDHCGIFLLIAGSATAIARLALQAETAHSLILTIWSAAVVGILQSLFWIQAPKWLTALLCVGAGWVLVPYAGELRAALSATDRQLIVGGGLLYSLGAVSYALKRPTPLPGVFGYHEIFHILVVVAAGLHFVAINRLVG